MPGYVEGEGKNARFNKPTGIAVIPGGTHAVVSDSDNHRIRLVNLETGSTSLLAGDGNPQWADGMGSKVSFALPAGVALSNDGKFIYIADSMNNRIRTMSVETGETKTISGPGLQDSPPGTDGVGTAASFSQPLSVAVSKDWLVIADTLSHRLRMLSLLKGCDYTAGKGFSYCPPCPAGTASKTGGALCEVCPENTYSGIGASSCTPCPDGSNSQQKVGGTSGAVCVCDDSYYGGLDSSGKFACLKCPLGARCSDGTCAFQNTQLRCGKGSTAQRIQGTWVMRSGQMSLLDCPQGFLVVNASADTQTCLACTASTYSLQPTDNCGKDSCVDRECQKCPIGASCKGKNHFEPLVAGSEWKRTVDGATVKMRLKSCPSGYVLVRNQNRPENDECVKCPPNTYMAEPASFDSGKGVSSTAAILQDGLNLCLPCPAGSTCNGEDEVIIIV
jgi:hypothetical protein